jgi:hypothetical protein
MTKIRPKPKQPEFSAQPQKHATPHPVRIKELYADRKMYENYPSYQRGSVWPIKYKQGLINTILLGRNFPSLVAYKEIDVLGHQAFFITDGQQRLTTIMEFMDGKFKTWTHAQKQDAEPNSPPPVSPGKYFDELDLRTKNLLLDYIVNISIDEKSSEDMAREHFRQSQNHIALSPAERIDTYESRAKAAAQRIEAHPFWADFYMGREFYRKRILQSSFYLLALEISPNGMVDLQGKQFIHNLASGKKDDKITEELIQLVLDRMDSMCCVFGGTEFTVRAAALAMYQAVYLIENTGITIRSETDRGKLTPWILQVIRESNELKGPTGYQRPLQGIIRKANQIAFWERHRETVLSLFGLRDVVVQI